MISFFCSDSYLLPNYYLTSILSNCFLSAKRLCGCRMNADVSVCLLWSLQILKSLLRTSHVRKWIKSSFPCPFRENTQSGDSKNLPITWKFKKCRVPTGILWTPKRFDFVVTTCVGIVFWVELIRTIFVGV